MPSFSSHGGYSSGYSSGYDIAFALSFRDLLLDVQAQVVASVPLPSERVLITVHDNVPHWQAEQDVLLRVSEEHPDVALIDGAGRNANLRYRTLTLIMRSRVLLDESFYDAIHLTNLTLGHLALEDLVCNAVELFQADATGRWDVAEPMYTSTLTLAKPDPKAPEWLSSSFDLVIPYLRAMTPDTIASRVPPPVIAFFSASANNIPSGTNVTLSWASTNGDTATLTPDGSAVAVTGSKIVAPLVTTSYVLVVTQAGITTSAVLTVLVEGAPLITSFTASSNNVAPGTPLTLTWTALNADTAFLAPANVQTSGTGAVLVNGTTTVIPQVTTTYTLTVTQNGTGLTASASLTVTVSADPIITAFAANVNNVLAGSPVVLAWTSLYGTTATITPDGSAVALNGSKTVTPSQTTTYTLAVTNASGVSTTAAVTVTVTMLAGPAIMNFNASSNLTNANSPVVLSWTSQNADTATINGSPVPVNGTLTVNPSITTTYTLVVTQTSTGLTATASTTVVVALVPPAVSSFTASQSVIASGTPVTLTWASVGANTATITPDGSAVAISGTKSVAPTTTTTYVLLVSNGSTTATASVTVTVAVAVAASATFIGQNSTAHGLWYQVGGTDGVVAAGLVPAAPSYAALDFGTTGQATLNPSDPNVRAFWDGPTNIDAFYFPGAAPNWQFSVDLNLTDGNPHQVSMYFLDFGGFNPTETIDILDVASGVVLDSRPLANFQNGVYLSWTIRGHVTIRVTRTDTQPGDIRPQFSALLFGGPTATPVAPSPPPVILSYYATPTNNEAGTYGVGTSGLVKPGQAATLHWTTQYATVCQIQTETSQGVGPLQSVSASGTLVVTPATGYTQSYRLYAQNGSLSTSTPVYVLVQPPDPPPAVATPTITAFTADRTSILQGQTVIFDWQSTGGASATLNSQSVPLSGEKVVLAIQTSGDYVLAVTGTTNTVQQTIHVTVTGANPLAQLNRPSFGPGNFTRLGVFRLPQNAAGWPTAFSYTGLACRYVGGQLRLFTGGHIYGRCPLYEVAYPGYGNTIVAAPTATLINQWGGDVWGGNIGNGTSNAAVFGLLWDEPSKRLFYSYSSLYTTGPNWPCLSWVDLNGDNPSFTVHTPGCIASANSNSHRIFGGSVKLPAWFSAQLGGRDLGVGFGEYQSIHGAGSNGPFLAACHAPTVTGQTLDDLPLVGYPVNSNVYSHRDANYLAQPNPNPVNGVGTSTWMDQTLGAGCLIDTGTSAGFLTACTEGTGWVAYISSALYSESFAYVMKCYSLADLLDVANGVKTLSQIQPAYWPLPLSPAPTLAASFVLGLTYDPTTGLLFVIVGNNDPVGSQYYPLVHVFQVTG